MNCVPQNDNEPSSDGGKPGMNRTSSADAPAPASGGLSESARQTDSPKRWERTQSEIFRPRRSDGGRGGNHLSEGAHLLMMSSSSEESDADEQECEMSVDGMSGEAMVSEKRQVYWDLPGAVEDNTNCRQPSLAGTGSSSSKVKVTLQTIHQKEELRGHAVTSGSRSVCEGATVSTTASSASSSSSTTKRYTLFEKKQSGALGVGGPTSIRITKRQGSYEQQQQMTTPPAPTHTPRSSIPDSGARFPADGSMTIAQMEQSVRQNLRTLVEGSLNEQCTALDHILLLIEQAATHRVFGSPNNYKAEEDGFSAVENRRHKLCDTLRHAGGLEALLGHASAPPSNNTYEVRLGSTKVLARCLTRANREHVAKDHDTLAAAATLGQTTRHDAGDTPLLRASTGVLRALFKVSEATCRVVVTLGGLETVLFSCRSADAETLRNAAVALANLALYGGEEGREALALGRSPDWLFPLAMSEDVVVRYYALFAVCALAVREEYTAMVGKTGILALVDPFLVEHEAADLVRDHPSHFKAHSDTDWLIRVLPMLRTAKTRGLAAFQFAVETITHLRGGTTQMLYNMGAVDALKEAAAYPSTLGTARNNARNAVELLGEKVLFTLSPAVPLWDEKDVLNWLKQIRFESYCERFAAMQVDGQVLLELTEGQLKEELGMEASLTRKRFIRKLVDLKITADYRSEDSTDLCGWLRGVDSVLVQHTHCMLMAGVRVPDLPSITEEHLRVDCHISQGVHRTKICKTIKAEDSDKISTSVEASDALTALSPNGFNDNEVFISYRRKEGAHLASLVKVHLEQRGFKVFLDIQRLTAGKFDEALLQSIRKSRHFIPILAWNSLDRCLDDHLGQDWVHKEIAAALKHQCNIVPVFHEFKWPEAEKLPSDMRAVSKYNGVKWVHDYQDACIEKIARFLISPLAPNANEEA